MAVKKGKYDKYFFKNHVVPRKFTTGLVFYSKQHEDAIGKKDLSVLWNCITQPFYMVKDAHSHDFDQFLHFFGGDSLHIERFDAEIEMCLGDELEKHIITEPTVLHIPAGMMHCPLNFKVVNKPVIFMNVALTPQYVREGIK